MAYEASYVDDWISTTLLNDAVIKAMIGSKVFDSVPDAAPPPPWITYQPASLIDVNGVGPGNRIMVNGLWDVRIVGMKADSADMLRGLANRVDKLLQGKSAQFSWGYILGTIREGVRERQFTRQSISLVQLIQTYRINAQVNISA